MVHGPSAQIFRGAIKFGLIDLIAMPDIAQLLINKHLTYDTGHTGSNPDLVSSIPSLLKLTICAKTVKTIQEYSKPFS